MRILDAATAHRTGTSTTSLLGFAAIGLAAGLAANFGRKLLVQGPSMLKGDWAGALKTEHRLVMTLFDALEKTTNKQRGKRTALLTQIKHALGKHAFEEENVIYPALRDHGLAAEAENLIIDHGDVKHFLFELEQMPNDGNAFLSKVGELRHALEIHMAEEEGKIFPALADKLSSEARNKLTMSMNKEGLKLA
jgi:hemerythrin superfamily protein